MEWARASALARVYPHSSELSLSRNRCYERCARETGAALLYNAARGAASRIGQVASLQLLAAYFHSSAEKLHSFYCWAHLPLTSSYKQKSEDCLQDFVLGLRVLTRGRREGP